MSELQKDEGEGWGGEPAPDNGEPELDDDDLDDDDEDDDGDWGDDGEDEERD